MANKDKNKYNEYMNTYMKDRYKKRRERAIEQLGGCCVVCGTTENLHFDHKDPTMKELTIAKMSSVSEERFQLELKKCQLLCEECHKKKSKSEFHIKDNVEKKCVCGKVFKKHTEYAGHKTWCKK